MTYCRINFVLLITILSGLWSTAAFAKPNASGLFCDTFPETTTCKGKKISCTYCHAGFPPDLGSFGGMFKQAMNDTDANFPTTSEEMYAVIIAMQDNDSDQDGSTDFEEIKRGTLPGNKSDKPAQNICKTSEGCRYDFAYAYKKVALTVCGEPADWEDVETYLAETSEKQYVLLHEKLDSCLDSENWIGKDGVIWEIGHYKIRPVGSVKSGEDEGVIPIVDYYADFQLFVYSQIDDNDARDQLLADYTVERKIVASDTTYTKIEPDRLVDGQVMQPEYRVGLLTSFWNLSFYLNYTSVARVLVAQAFNAYLGINLALMEGLNPPPEELSQFADYDGRGVDRFQCSLCHTTIDAMAYPFRNYNGLTGTSQVLAGSNAAGLQDIANLGDEDNLTPLSYSKPRMDFFSQRYPNITKMPESGYVLGKKVANLKEWAAVVANSDEFAANTVKDYWKVLVGHEPRSDEDEEYRRIWEKFKGENNYQVEKMIKDIVVSRSFGAP